MGNTVTRLMNSGEFYAAGFMEKKGAPRFERFALGLRRYLENRTLPQYNGKGLYPCGNFTPDMCVKHDYSYVLALGWQSELAKKDEELCNILKEEIPDYFYKMNLPKEHTIGGAMYTHSFPNYPRIIKEGFNSYLERIENMKDESLKAGLKDVVAGIRAFHSRSLEMLKEKEGTEELCKALERVPFNGARNLYEAIVAWNFIYYMDGCDNIGRLDADLYGYYNGEDITHLFRVLFENIDDNNGWSGALGPDYNPLTLQILKACKGMRRPSLELRVTPEMPEEIWQAAIKSIQAGGGSPSLYNEVGYQSALGRLFPEIPKKDRIRFCGGGCTETMLTGISNVGSLDAGINVAFIFEKYMRENLANAVNYEEFYNGFINEAKATVKNVLKEVSNAQQVRAKYWPQPMRTLLIDDCIDNGKDYNNGGARYKWSVINLAGLVNVIDSLLAIKYLVFEKNILSGGELLCKLKEGESFLSYGSIPRHGNDNKEANALASLLTSDICSAFEGEVPYMGGKFLPSSIQFTTYIDSGKNVGPTPDGRKSGAPLCDSIGAINNNDTCGVTALLNSAGAFCQKDMAGTPVLNIKLEKSHTIKYLKTLVEGYFNMGGMQMQVTCVSKEELLDAKEHPENYPNLIVRVGGYSEYFNRLTPELQQTVIDRTICNM